MLTNVGLVQHAKKALSEKWGYVYGTYGQILTESLYQAKAKQYPDNINRYESFIRENWMGNNVTDCVGLIKSYLWWKDSKPIYDSKTDVSANGMFELAKDKGAIDTIPEIVGLCVWHKGHIGVYIGNGVIESHGTKSGVILTPLTGKGSTPWTHWLKCPFIEYVDDKKESDSEMYVTYKEKSEKVRTIQEILVELNYTDKDGKQLQLDGDFGSRTLYAINTLQTKYSLPKRDGIGYEELMFILSEYRSIAEASESEYKLLVDKFDKIKEIVG